MLKKVIVLLLLSMAVCGFACGPDYPYEVVRRSQTFLINTDEFPEYDFYSIIQGYKSFIFKNHKISSTTPFGRGFQQDQHRVLAVRKDMSDHYEKLLQTNMNPLDFDFCSISPYQYYIHGNYVSNYKDSIICARRDYKIAKIENKTVHLYLYRTVTTDDGRIFKITYYKQPDIFSYPERVEKYIQEYQSIITGYFQEYKNRKRNEGGSGNYMLYLDSNQTLSFIISSFSFSDSYDNFGRKIADLIDKRYIDRRPVSSNYIDFGVLVVDGKLYFEKSYNPYMKSLYRPEVLKTVVDTLVRVPVRKEFKLNDYLTNDFYLKLLSTVVLESFLLLLLSFFMTSIKNMKIIRLVGVGALASVITLPLLWFIWPLFISNWLLYFWTGEIMVAAIEAVIYKKLLKTNWRDAIIISIACNAFSCTIGLYTNVWW